jgi:DNA-binding beta-propeller fold protein YncE
MTSTTPSKVFVVHAYAHNDWTPGVWFINSSSLVSHQMTDNSGYVGAAPVKVAADSVTDRVFVSNYYDYMPILHGPSENLITWVRKKSFQASYGIDASERNDLVYMAAIDTGELVIFDRNWAELNPDYGACHHAPPEARVLRMVAVDEATRHVFVTSPPDANKGQTDSKVFVLDEDTLLAETGGAPSDTTCSWNFLGAGDVGVTAIPGPAWIKTMNLSGAVSAGEEGIAVNPVTGRVYVTDGPGDKLHVLRDSTTPANILWLTAITVGDNPQGVAVNPETNKIYVANARNTSAPYGTVTVVDGNTNTVIKTIELGP